MKITMHHSFFKLIAKFFLMNLFISHAPAETTNFKTIQCEEKTLTKGWEILANHKIFFGHQSVGSNILNGLELLAEKCNKKITLLETRDANKINNPMLIHTNIGKNQHPESKLADFNSLMNLGMGEKVDIAFLKFCYIDFHKNTDIDALFTKYTDTLTSLSERYPNTKFLAISAPLTTLQTGIKPWIKKILGRYVSGIEENKKRHEFNERLRLKYSANNSLFDIATIESTLPNGSREKYTANGKEYYLLYNGYTNDGGHLNEAGQIHVALALLRFLGTM